jgi:hypothetical protein
MSTQSTQKEFDRHNPRIKQLISDTIQFILFTTLAEHKVFIKRADINKNILKDLSNQFRNIIEVVRRDLDTVFGLKLTNLDDHYDKFGISSLFTNDKKINDILNSKSKSSLEDNVDNINEVQTEKEELNKNLKYSMLMIALSIIFMNENEMEADLFWEGKTTTTPKLRCS